jgi:hypothetical protein
MAQIGPEITFEIYSSQNQAFTGAHLDDFDT